MIENKYAVSMDICRIHDLFHVWFLRVAILVHCSFFIYINDLPNCLSTASPRMFADDTNVRVASSTLHKLENVSNDQELQNLNIWLKVNKLSLNIVKTEYMIIGSRQRVSVNVDGNVDITINDKPVKK